MGNPADREELARAPPADGAEGKLVERTQDVTSHLRVVLGAAALTELTASRQHGTCSAIVVLLVAPLDPSANVSSPVSPPPEGDELGGGHVRQPLRCRGSRFGVYGVDRLDTHVDDDHLGEAVLLRPSR